MSERIMGAVALGGSETLVRRDAMGRDRTSGSVATSGGMTQINNRSGRARLPGPRPALTFIANLAAFTAVLVLIWFAVFVAGG